MADRISSTWLDYFLPCVKGENPRLCANVEYGDQASVEAVERPNHIIPLYAEALKVGIMVSIRFRPASEWRISDAFGRFQPWGSASPQAAFQKLMRHLEKAFSDEAHGKTIPLRWRQAFDITLGCPVHLDMIPGKSMQLPLALAVIRELGRDPDSDQLPLGDGPVFCTGEMFGYGQIGRVEHVVEKAEGFLREYGEGRPAVLPKANKGDLGSLQGWFQPLLYFSTAADLLKLDGSLTTRLSSPPEHSQLDVLFNALRHKLLTRDMEDFGSMVHWLETSEGGRSTVYQYRLAIDQAYALASKGFVLEPWPQLEKAQRLACRPDGCREPFGCGGCIGIEDRIHLGCVWAGASCNSGDCREVEE